MKNIKLTILGIATLLFALTLNFRHAIDDYGISKNKLHIEVLAQSNNSGGDSSSVDSSNGNSSGESSSGGSSSNNNGGGSNIYHYDHLQGKPKSCYTKAGADVQYSTTSVDLGAEWTRTVDLTKAGKRFL